jgi:WhiB family redox-sensing transcriptional regulator
MIRTASARSVAPDWLKQAACRADGIDPDEMFPDNNPAGITHARQICAPCPVREQCLADAMATEGTRTARNRYGIRAGLTGSQRRALYDAQRKRQTGQQTKAAA